MAQNNGYPQADARNTAIARAMLEISGLRNDLARLHAEATHHRDQCQRASVVAREATMALVAEQERTAWLEAEVRRLREDLRRANAVALAGAEARAAAEREELAEVRVAEGTLPGAW